MVYGSDSKKKISNEDSWIVFDIFGDEENEKDDKKTPGVPDGTGPGKNSKKCPFNKGKDKDDDGDDDDKGGG